MATGIDKFNSAVIMFMMVAGCANIERDVPEGQDAGFERPPVNGVLDAGVEVTPDMFVFPPCGSGGYNPGCPDAMPEPDAPECNPNYGCYGTCIEDHDCGHNAVCRDHQCRDFCECDEDCENGMSCRSGACRPL